MQAVALLISARWVIPVEPAGAVLDDHCVAVAGGRIVAVLPSGEAARGFDAREHLRLDRHALIPGLVNLHTHAAMTLLRGLADDLPLMSWLRDHVWPAEARHVSPEFVYDGTLLACAEMLRGGVTFPSPPTCTRREQRSTRVSPGTRRGRSSACARWACWDRG